MGKYLEYQMHFVTNFNFPHLFFLIYYLRINHGRKNSPGCSVELHLSVILFCASECF